MAVGKPADDAVLIRIQVLELIHEHIVPPGSQLGCRAFVGAQELLRERDEVIKIRQIPGPQRLLVPREKRQSAITQRLALKAMKTEKRQRLRTAFAGNSKT